MRRLVPLLLAVFTLAGCGLKGDLYLPAPKPAATPIESEPETESAPQPTDPDADKEPGQDRPASENP